MRCLTGSQCKSGDIGVTWQNLGTEYTKRAHAFWIRWKKVILENDFGIYKKILTKIASSFFTFKTAQG